MTALAFLILSAGVQAEVLYKNTASQKHAVYCYDTSGEDWKTGDASNITAYVSLDGGAAYQLNDTNPTEIDATNMPGLYVFDLLTSETNGNLVVIHASSSTGNTIIEPASYHTLAAVGGRLDVDVGAISSDTTSANNLELQYDTTGLSGDTFPATQAQLSGIAVGAGGLSTVATTYTLSTGSVTGGSLTSTEELDGTSFIIEDDATNTDIYIEFDVGSVGVGTQIQWNGYMNAQGDSWQIYGWDWVSSSWKQIGSRAAVNPTTIVEEDWTITTAMTGTSGNLGIIRIRFTSTDGTVFGTDRILCQYTQLSQTVGYADGAIWVDSAGDAGAEVYVNGTADNPCPWANALTINATLGLNRFHIANGNTVTLDASAENYTIWGDNWTLTLNGQSIANAWVRGASVSGTATGSGSEFHQCSINAVTLADCFLLNCAIASTVTCSAASTYYLDNCFSGVAGTATPGLDFGSGVANTNVNLRHYSGGIRIANIGANGTDNMSLEGWGQYVLDSTCAGGVLAVRGSFTETDNAGGAVTVSDDARYDQTQVLNALVDDATQIDASQLNTHTAITPATVGAAMTLANDAITAAKFDESTAFPLTLADTGSNKIARTGADSDTLETLSDEIAALNDVSTAEVNAQVDAAIVTYHLDHIFAVEYDPASKPGVSTSLWNEMIESDGGVSRFTANALEQAPGGSGGDATLANQTSILAYLVDIEGTGFTSPVASLAAIRTRGDAAWVTGGAGSGSITFTYTLREGDEDTGDPIPDAQLSVYTGSDKTGFVASAYTNASGQAVFELDAGTYYVWRKKARYTFTNPDTEVVN